MPGWRAERSSADVSGRVGGEGLAGRRRAIHGLGRERESGEDLADFARILNGGDQAQAPATPRASEDVELEGAMHELGPGPVAVRRLGGRRGNGGQVLQSHILVMQDPTPEHDARERGR